MSIAQYLRDMVSDRDNTNLTREDVVMLQDAADCLDDLTRDDAIDAAHDDPELNAVADLRTLADSAMSNPITQCLSDHADKVVELCDAYIALRAMCPPRAIVVTPGDEFTGEDDDGNPTTFFDAIVGALELAEVHTYILEVK